MSDLIKDKSTELYKIMKCNRGDVAKFLEENGSYDTLKQCIKTIEEMKKDKNRNIFSDMCLGKMGLETNKQRAIYELPTHELVNVINTITNLLNVDTVEEMCAGQGLLSKMLQQLTELNVKATDGKQWIQTYNNDTYVDVETKLVSQHRYDNDNTNKLLVVSWIPEKSIYDFVSVIEVKKPNQFILIGERNDKTICDIINRVKLLRYKVINIPVKQICYRDYYANNVFFPDDSCRSSLTLVVRDNIDINLKKIKATCGSENFCERLREYSDKMYLQDLVVMEILPEWCMNVLTNHTTEREMVMFVKDISECFLKKYIIPHYIRNNNEFVFWLSQVNTGWYPSLIKKHSKFVEYKNYIEILESESGLQKLQEKNVLPDWVSNMNLARNYMWLDFSDNQKTWKESYNTFIHKLRILGFI
jgi:hypothetical protein